MIVICPKIPEKGERTDVYRGSWLPLPAIGEQVDLLFRDEQIGSGRVVEINQKTRLVTIEVM